LGVSSGHFGPRRRKAFSPGSKVEPGLKARTKASLSTSENEDKALVMPHPHAILAMFFLVNFSIVFFNIHVYTHFQVMLFCEHDPEELHFAQDSVLVALCYVSKVILSKLVYLLLVLDC
jgi:hypothetical protein